MNCNKKLNLTHSTSNAPWWRMGLILALIVTIGVINLGCKDNEEEDDSEYYVKYELNSTADFHVGGTLNVTINKEDNKTMTESINTHTPWETIIGPVKKGFNATLSARHEDGAARLRIFTQISVSKDGAPFILRKIDDNEVPRNAVQINYTINF
ncbi:MAG: hypothetical protein FWD09_07940 [Lentimicrobiaceae bacterium]|nr:hypothetical protein [Lentimicrobiaceae bacterium]